MANEIADLQFGNQQIGDNMASKEKNQSYQLSLQQNKVLTSVKTIKNAFPSLPQKMMI